LLSEKQLSKYLTRAAADKATGRTRRTTLEANQKLQHNAANFEEAAVEVEAEEVEEVGGAETEEGSI